MWIKMHLFIICCLTLISFTKVTCGDNVVKNANNNQEEEECTNQNEKKNDWKWDIDATHPCNIPKVTYSQLIEKFGSSGLPTSFYSKPIIILQNSNYDNTTTTYVNKKFKEMTTYTNLLKHFGPDFKITLSSSNTFSDFRKTVSLQEYLDNYVIAKETTPNQFSNETWYFFGETFTSQWEDFLEDYKLPPCTNCLPKYAATSFGIGAKGSGIQWHFHGNGFSENIHGRKYWLLYPEDYKVKFHSNYTSRHWMEEIYNESDSLLSHCTVEEGDLVYFPNGWYHATINLDRYNVFVSTFLRDE